MRLQRPLGPVGFALRHNFVDLVAAVRLDLEHEIFVERCFERSQRQCYLLVGNNEVRMVELYAHHGHAGLGGGEVGFGLGRGRDGRLALRGRLGSLRDLRRGGGLGLG